MRKIVIKTGKEGLNLQEIKKYLHSMYPGVRDGLSWAITYSEGEKEGAYGISRDGTQLEYFPGVMLERTEGDGYRVLERSYIGYEHMLERILQDGED